MDLAAGGPGRLTSPLTSHDAREYQPAWSPDGEFIAYVTWSEENGGQIWKLRTNGQFPPQLVTTSTGYYEHPGVVARTAPKLSRCALRSASGRSSAPLASSRGWMWSGFPKKVASLS